ncbi:MAG TPA: alkaline phosphatase family protein [Thermoplasmata archaeon]|nr:alkaline phosphatase family protein [Thermoplasmata archaeon]
MPNPLGRGRSRASSERLGWLLLCLGVVAAFVAPIALDAGGPPPTLSAYHPSPAQVFASRISHIVFVVLENHAFDNYFGQYCRAAGPYCAAAVNGLPAGTCVPLNVSQPAGACVRPFPFTAKNWSVTSLMPHNWNSSAQAWNGGLMNGFYSAEESGFDPFGYYNGTTAPLYWDLAEQYGLGDNFYSSLLDYSLPNHWHIVAGQAPKEILTHKTGARESTGPNWFQDDRTYLNQANKTKSIEDLLAGTSTPWSYYEWPLGTYNHAIIDLPNQTGQAFAYFNPQAAKYESYQPTFINHFVNATEFYADARNGTLPSLSWVMPTNNWSDHPPDNSTIAQSWTASLVNAVESSPQWSSTAMFIAWDDYGGFYDHVAPPNVTGHQLGFRVGFIVVSPYTPQGYVSHNPYYFESVLHLMEVRFDLGCVTATDCTAPLPYEFFNFTQPARPPMLFPTTFSVMHYPMPLQNGTSIGALPPYYPPSNFTLYFGLQAPAQD